MCCFYNERFTLFCCVHTYQQWDLLDLPPFLRNVLRYVRTRRISVKPIYMRSCNGFHAHESPHPPSGRVGDVVTMLQIEFLGIGNHGVAEAASFQRRKGIFFAPHPIDFIEILGADGSIRFQSDVSLRLHEIKDIVVVTLDRFPVFPDETVLSVDTAQRDSGGAAIPLLYLFDTADEADEAEAEQYLSKLTAGEFSPLMYESKATARSEFAQFRQMFLLIGGILCAIIGLVGLLNFFNAMMTGILSRRREFAVLQAVGMTNRQLKTMLIYEGLFYAMSSVAAAFILSLAVGPLAGKMLGSMFWFFEYRFTILPVLLTIPVFLLLGWLIPCMMYDNAAKCSVVEQLRDAQ